MNEIVLLQSAQADLLELISIYGDSLYDIIDRDLERIRTMPGIAPFYHGHFQRKVVHKTPFAIFYRQVGTRVMVSFVIDLRQDSKMIERRLTKG